jgi:hypothetical protein
MRQYFYEAARMCDDLANDVDKDLKNIYKLQDALQPAFKGNAASSLDSKLVDNAGLVSGAEGILRGAAERLRRAAMTVQ